MPEAARLRDAGHGRIVSYSQQGLHSADAAVPRRLQLLHVRARAACRQGGVSAPDEVLAIARAGREAGCHEALFTLGDKPELRYRAAREELGGARLRDHARVPGRDVRARAARDGLLPHANPGVLTREDIVSLRRRERIAGH